MKLTLILSITLLFASAASLAETLTVPTYSVANSSAGVLRPTRGISMSAVTQKFGQAQQKSAAIGEPPITKWTYPDFIVFFEYSQVIHSVIPR
ncbi:MAG: hypothetical protein COA83_04785 [Methylophaga sp.]|nr:MAG: hypothetical protein COA83_04785 [Methylophaga sp.]